MRRRVAGLAHSARHRRHPTAPRSHAGPGRTIPGRWDCKGRADISPLREAGAATPVVVQGAKALAVVARGADSPCLMGPGRAESPGRDATAKRCLSRGGFDTRQHPRPAECIRWTETAPCGFASLTDATGGSAGDVKSPRQGARGSTTHTLYFILFGLPLYTLIIPEHGAGMEMLRRIRGRIVMHIT